MDVAQIDSDTARAWIAQGDTALVDVREADEHARARIPGAHLIPLATLTVEKIAALPGRRVIIHCASGVRSAQAVARLREAGREIVSLSGGLAAWRASGGPVIEDRAAPIPIQRQVMIVAGTLVLLGAVLGALVHPWFHLLSAFVGAGLVFAGITGICTMALLLAKLPYNRVAMR